jgi:hypothetical protein
MISRDIGYNFSIADSLSFTQTKIIYITVYIKSLSDTYDICERHYQIYVCKSLLSLDHLDDLLQAPGRDKKFSQR